MSQVTSEHRESVTSKADVVPPELGGWVAQQLNVPETLLAIKQIAGDASPRRYFRVARKQEGGLTSASSETPFELVFVDSTHMDDSGSPRILSETVIAVTSPASENNDAFLQVQRAFAGVGLRVPAQVASDLDKGFFLMEDFGDVLLSARLNPSTVDSQYPRALALLIELTELSISDTSLPRFDADRIAEELQVFIDWFLLRHLDLPRQMMPGTVWDDLVRHLTEGFLNQVQCVAHRDFHSRNIMCLKGDDLGLIDFQDAVVGPVTYDPVSLLKDCYVQWPRSSQLRWLEGYRGELLERHVAAPDAEHFVRDFDLVGLQRHLRVLGVFARLSLRDQKSGYLNDLPLVLHYTREVLTLYRPEAPIGAFGDWFEEVVMPLVPRQEWYIATQNGAVQADGS